jgi:hypothetical protein
MTLFTENFKKFSKIINMFYNTQEQRYQSIFLNFEDSYGYLLNPNFAGRFSFKFDGTPPGNFFVDMQKFLSICAIYDSIEINDKLEIMNGTDKFKLMSFTEAFDILDFDTADFDKYTLTSASFTMMKNAFSFIGQNDLQANYSGVNILGSKIVSSDSMRVFEGMLDTTYPHIQVPAYIAKILILAENLGTNIYFKDGKNSIILSLDDGNFMIISPTVTNLILPPVDDPDFIEQFDHPTSFTVNREMLSDQFIFFEDFVKEINTQPIYITIESETSLVIEVKGDETGKRSIELKACDKEIVGGSFLLIRDKTLAAFNAIEDEYVQVQYALDAKVINLTGETNKKKHIAVVTIGE